jgi:tripartite-type tricarboxylate transporter receptor subunit TctC
VKLPRRKFLRLAAGAAALPVVRIARALDYPTRPVHMIVGFAPGGGADIGAPRSTPVEIIDILNRQVNLGLADPKLKSKFADLAQRYSRVRLPILASSLRQTARSGPRWSSSPISSRSDGLFRRVALEGST